LRKRDSKSQQGAVTRLTVDGQISSQSLGPSLHAEHTETPLAADDGWVKSAAVVTDFQLQSVGRFVGIRAL
jgi:hypothetical protein